MSTLARTDLIVLDDWGLSPLDTEARRNLLELFDNRHGHRSTLSHPRTLAQDYRRSNGADGPLPAGGVLVGESIQTTELGTPQSSPLSPLLANIQLDDLDHERERRGHWFTRYADDLLVLVKWRGTRTMVRNLQAPGTDKHLAILTALGSKSHRHLSRTPATRSGMTKTKSTKGTALQRRIYSPGSLRACFASSASQRA